MSRIHACARLWGEREKEGAGVFSRSSARGWLLGVLHPVVPQSVPGCALFSCCQCYVKILGRKKCTGHELETRGHCPLKAVKEVVAAGA